MKTNNRKSVGKFYSAKDEVCIVSFFWKKEKEINQMNASRGRNNGKWLFSNFIRLKNDEGISKDIYKFSSKNIRKANIIESR